jgi:hypothetical protein
MYLDTNKSLGFISALALTVAFGCSSKNTSDGTGAGGTSSCQFNCNTGGSGDIDASQPVIQNICNGLFAGSVCKLQPTIAVTKTPNMLIVIDESGSMAQSPSPGVDPSTKWNEMSQALSAALSQQKVRSNINFGLELFPSSGDPNSHLDPNSADPNVQCEVPSGDAAIEVPIDQTKDQLNAILDAVGASAPAGGTPTNRALQQAYEYFTQGAGKSLPGKKYVLLATDGGPNCNAGLSCSSDTCTQNMDLLCGDHTLAGGPGAGVNCCDNGYGFICLDNLATVSEISTLAAAGIATYVVGIPGSDAYSATLDAMATAGGVPNTAPGATNKYYRVSAGNALADLQAAFTSIVTQLVTSCDIPLDKTPSDYTQVQVAIDCNKVTPLPNNKADGGVDGFFVDYTQSPAHIQVEGAPCTYLQVNGAKEVDIIIGCTHVQ